VDILHLELVALELLIKDMREQVILVVHHLTVAVVAVLEQ
jgi:hypothetical protein